MTHPSAPRPYSAEELVEVIPNLRVMATAPVGLVGLSEDAYARLADTLEALRSPAPRRPEPSEAAIEAADEVLCLNEMSNSGGDKVAIEQALRAAYAMDFPAKDMRE